MRRPSLRTCSDAVRVAVTVTGLVSLVVSGPKTAAGYLLVAVVAWAVRRLDPPPRAEALFIGLLAVDVVLQATGVMAAVDERDTFGHVLLPAAIAPIVLFAGRRSGVVTGDLGAPRIAVVVLVAGWVLGLGAAWELTEWFADVTLGTNMSLDYGDTIHDLVCDAAGGLLGAIAAVVLDRGQPYDFEVAEAQAAPPEGDPDRTLARR